MINKLRPFHNDFIPERRASGNVIMVPEIIHFMNPTIIKILKNNNNNLVAINVNSEIAYDRKEYGFIYRFFVFSISRIIELKSSWVTFLSPLVALDSAIRFPLYLFIIRMEFLNHLIEEQYHVGHWKSIGKSSF